MTGAQLERMVVDRLACEYTVFISRWLDHIAKTDLLVKDGEAYYAIQLKWNGGVKPTQPIRSVILQKWRIQHLKCITIVVHGMQPSSCSPAKFIKICREAKDGQIVHVNGFTWTRVE